jgi:hypothetical protein
MHIDSADLPSGFAGRKRLAASRSFPANSTNQPVFQNPDLRILIPFLAHR